MGAAPAIIDSTGVFWMEFLRRRRDGGLLLPGSPPLRGRAFRRLQLRGIEQICLAFDVQLLHAAKPSVP
jgi:hypothetical protein